MNLGEGDSTYPRELRQEARVEGETVESQRDSGSGLAEQAEVSRSRTELAGK